MVSQARAQPRGARAFDFVAAFGAAALSAGMLVWPDRQGLLQRLIFPIAFASFGMEAVRLLRSSGGAP